METLMFLVALVTLITVERVPSLRVLPSPFLRPFFGTDLFYFLTGGVTLALIMRLQAWQWARALDLPMLASLQLPFPLLVGTALVLYDLGAYVLHVLLHRVDALWELHKVHHSSRTLDWLATFRAHIFEHALRHCVSLVLLISLGFPLAVVGITAAIYGIWAALNHANVRLPLEFAEPLLITPRLHRLHHTPPMSAHNFGTIFSLWDRYCGTLVTASGDLHDALGVPGEVTTYPQSWLAQPVEPLRRMWAETPQTPSETA